MRPELDRLYQLIEDNHTVMMTTRRSDGHLASRAMATQKPAPGADLWFVTSEGSAKLAEIAQDAHVNLSFVNRKWEWVSVSGTARISSDRETIRQLWAPDWAAWFPDEGDPRHGTADDPRMVLIGVDVQGAVFFEVDKPQPVVLYELVKGWLTGTQPDVGQVIGSPKRTAIRTSFPPSGAAARPD
jgi:general stress protein 26